MSDTPEIKAARKANRAAIVARLKTLSPPPGAKPLPLYKTPPTYKILTPEERAAVVAAEKAKPQKTCC
jgi:hypothetical protein